MRLLAVDEPESRAGRRSGALSGTLEKWLAVADAPLALYGADAINRHLSDLDWVSRAAIAHEAVVESFIEQPAVLPMKLFTIFLNDERALDHVRAERRRIGGVIDRVAGHHEWGVRVTLDSQAGETSRTPPASKRRAGPSGAAYLAAKHARRRQADERAGRARDIVGELFERLDREAAASRRRTASELPAQGGALLLDAAFLVPRDRSRRFVAAIARQAKALEAPGYRLTTSGPWPPYSFIQD